MDRDALAGEMLPFLRSKGYLIHEPTGQEMELLKKAVQSLRERAKTLVEMAELSEFYFSQEIVYEEKAAEKFLKKEVVPVYEEIIAALMRVGVLTKEGCHGLILELAERRGEPLVKIAQPLRVALTGKTVSPPMDEVMDALGKEEVIGRLHKAIEFIQKQSEK